MTDAPVAERLHPELGALWRHRALVAAALYAFVALVGALYYALLLGGFGINPFDYWEASDFLLATFREPASIGFGLVAVSFYLSLTGRRTLNDWLFERWPRLGRLLRYERWGGSRWIRPGLGPVAGLALTLLWFVVVMGGVAGGAAIDARRGEGERVRFQIEGAAPREAQLLTATNRFLFLVPPSATPGSARVLVVPVEALVALEHCGESRGLHRSFFRHRTACADEAPAPAVAPMR